MQHAVHQQQAMSVGNQFHGVIGFMQLEPLFVFTQSEQIVGLLLDVLVSGDQEATSAPPAAGY